MKIPITDKFLMSMLEVVGDIKDYLASNKYQQIHMMMGNENPIFKQYRKDINKRAFSQLVYYLKRKNYIKVKNLEGKRAIMLTKKGASRAIEAQWKFDKKKKRKDGKWIMIIFDIPRNREKSRALLRSILKNLGYALFQHSVWVTPYDVSRHTEDMLQHYSLDGYVKIFIVEQLD